MQSRRSPRSHPRLRCWGHRNACKCRIWKSWQKKGIRLCMRPKAISAKVALLPGGYRTNLSEFSMAYHNREPLHARCTTQSKIRSVTSERASLDPERGPFGAHGGHGVPAISPSLSSISDNASLRTQNRLAQLEKSLKRDVKHALHIIKKNRGPMPMPTTSRPILPKKVVLQIRKMLKI